MIETLAGLFVALSSQGIFAKTFSGVWFSMVFCLATSTFFYLKKWPPLGGACATVVLTLLSLAYLGREVLYRADTWGWALTLGATTYLSLELLNNKPFRPYLFSALGGAILFSLAYGAALFLSPAFFIMLLSLLAKDLPFARTTSQILFLYTALSPAGLWFGPAIVIWAQQLINVL